MTSKPPLAVLTRLTSQVHISASPPPRSLAESKQIFAALQGFGEIISFRNLKVSFFPRRSFLPYNRDTQFTTGIQYDIRNDTERERPLIAMFDTSDAAERAIAASPLTITLPPPTPPAFTPNPFASPVSPSASSAPKSSPASSSSDPPTITCTLSPSRHNYERSIRRNPFYNMFHIDKTSAIYADMRSEETGTPLAELADVLMRTKGVTFATQRFGTRVHAQRLGADSLMGLWRRGVRERRAKEMENGSVDGEKAEKGEKIEGAGERERERAQLKRVSRERLQGGEERGGTSS
ncbi:hypothetical protein F1880_005012 [Penicillium rolfsii]|nr:hypothetical protein F1880_005012 [Penicillium rolfsii]